MPSSAAFLAFEPGAGTDHHIIGVFGNGTGYLGAGRKGFGLGFGTRQFLKCAGKDDGFSGKRTVRVDFLVKVFNRYFFAQPADGENIVLFFEKFDNVMRHRFADAVD